MAALRIPDRFRSALARVADMSETQLSQVESALRSVPRSTYSQKVSQHLASQISFLPPKEARSLADALMALYIAKCDSNKPASEVSEDVRSFLMASRDGQSSTELETANADGMKLLVDRLSRLLSIESFDLNAKATALMGEYERLFQSARIMSDVRHVFGHGDPPTKIIGSVLVHSLKVEYFENGQEKELYFALDSTDVRTLIETLTRVITKESLIKSQVSASDIPMISQ